MRPHRGAQYGVRNPKHNPSAGTNAATVIHDPEKVQHSIRITKRVAATDSRRSNSATPAVPLGNIENNLCTLRE
jgi:hypothetical protein